MSRSGQSIGYHISDLCHYCVRYLSRKERHAFFFYDSAVISRLRPNPCGSTYTWEDLPTLKLDFSDGLVGDPCDWLFPTTASNRALPYWLPYRKPTPSDPASQRHARVEEALQALESFRAHPARETLENQRRRPREEDETEDVSWEERVASVRTAANGSWGSARRIRRRVEEAHKAADEASNWNDPNGSVSLNYRVLSFKLSLSVGCAFLDARPSRLWHALRRERARPAQ